MDVRPARPEEYAEAGRVTADAYREHVRPRWEADWHRYLEEIADVAGRAGVSTVLVAVDDGRILGTTTVEFDTPITDGEPPLQPHEARLRMFGVDPAARGRGVGQALLDAALAEARRRGRTRIVLNTTDAMAAARRLYERNGFVLEGEHVFENDFRMWAYGRDL